ncbi:MAG: hypothetical protein ACYSU0_04945 [Planctomycetota bacterium]
MKTEFIGSRPGAQRPRAKLRKVLRAKELNAAVAFCTSAGAHILRKDADSLRNSDSFLVVADNSITDLDALRCLQSAVSGEILVHFGATLPVERKANFPLMHAKLFLGKDGKARRLWAGSHNLTAKAVSGINYEVALSLTGSVDDGVFVEAEEYLAEVRRQAIPITHIPPGSGSGGGDDVRLLVVHAESDGLHPAEGVFVHLCLPNTDFDSILRPPAEVILYLYPPGQLDPDSPDTDRATQVVGGDVTALSFTARHPRVGTPADWQAAQYMIDAKGQKPLLAPAQQIGQWVVSQSAFRVTGARPEMHGALLLVTRPQAKLSRLDVERDPFEIEEDLIPFFTKTSKAHETGLRYRPVAEVGSQVDLSPLDYRTKAHRVLEELDCGVDVLGSGDREKFAGSPCIHVAKYCIKRQA